MKFLIDANLPPAFAEWLISQGHDALHVSALNLETAPDREIWKHAGDLNACIVTKDEDFVLLHAIDQAGPPIVWIRIGNAVRRVLLQRLPAIWSEVMSALERGEKIIEIR